MRSLFPLCAALAIAACGGSDPVDSQADETAGLPEGTIPSPQAAGGPPSPAQPGAAALTPSPGRAIPAALHGRWGLTPGDCTSTRGDAKGLLTISADEMRFYESVGRPDTDAEADADSISGTFSFTGEGQAWSKFQALALQGRDLVRTESNPTASFSYAKCN